MSISFVSLFLKLKILFTVSRFDLEAHDLLESHCLLDNESQVLAVVKVSTDRTSNGLVVLEGKIEVLALLEVFIKKGKFTFFGDVDELELGLGDVGARHGVSSGANEFVLLAGEEDVLADDGALGASVLAVLEGLDVENLAGTTADADEVVLLEVTGSDGEGVSGVGVGTFEVFIFEVIIEIFLIGVRSHF